MKRIVWSDGNNVFVIRKGKTSNDKISDGSELVQTYTFSMEQWVLASTSKGFGTKKFFSLDSSNCLDCPFSGNQGKGGCYTHKGMQYLGFLSMLRSIKASDLTPLDDSKRISIVGMCIRTYIRFGTYGEPSLIPIDLIERMTNVGSNWTGYTHQWEKGWAQEYRDYFMASRHDADEAIGWRSFQAIDNDQHQHSNAVGCPASKEGGYKSNCATCGLCSGLLGKGKKDVKILIH
tara:strand:- start:1817 stop:2515 length:699 start_codon:yes stop_codon:yes gene_type:complete